MPRILIEHEGQEPAPLKVQASWSMAGFLIALDFVVNDGETSLRCWPDVLESAENWEAVFGPQVPWPKEEEVLDAMKALVRRVRARSAETRFGDVVKVLAKFTCSSRPDDGWLSEMEVRGLLIACRWVRESIQSREEDIAILDTGNGYPLLAYPTSGFSSDIDQLLLASRDAPGNMRILFDL